MNDPIYLLTSVKTIPVIVKCETEKDIERYSNKRSMVLGESCAKRNIESGEWVNETNSDRIASIINAHLYDVECWIPREDAFVSD